MGYLFGTITETIGVMKRENDKFGYEIDQLRDTRNDLKSTTKGIFYEVGKLQQDSKELDESLQQFDQLRKDLAEIAEKNEGIGYLVDDINGQMDAMTEVISNNERASLLSIYYEVSTRDREEGLSESEYDRFLGRLNLKTKKYFEECGTFHDIAGDDDIIDLREFEALLDEVIGKQEQEFIKEHIGGGR